MERRPLSYGGEIQTFDSPKELTFESDWIPNQGWVAPTLITLRLTPALGGTLVELFHHRFERTGGDVRATHAGYEEGWGMTQLTVLKRIVEAQRNAGAERRTRAYIMAKHQTETTLVLSRVYDVPADRLFEAWTTKEDLLCWYSAAADFVIHSVDVDLRVGGKMRAVFGPKGSEPITETDEYREIVPGQASRL